MLSRGMMSFTLILMVVVPTILLIGLDGSTGTMVTPPEKYECDVDDVELADASKTYCGEPPTSDCYCYKGTYYKRECDSMNRCSTSCPSCPSDTFAPYVNRCTECRNVTVCKDNEQVVKKAAGKNDTVCGCRDWPIPREVCERYNCTDLSGPAHPVLNTREPALLTPEMQEGPDNCYPGGFLAAMFFAGFATCALFTCIYLNRKKCCQNSENPPQTPSSNHGPADANVGATTPLNDQNPPCE